MTSKPAHTVLIIDDEEYILSSLQRLLRNDFNVLTATSGQAGIQLMHQHHVHAIVTDQRMPEMNGVEFLASIKHEFPDTIRMIITGYADLKSVVEAINTGEIYRYMVKPWNPEEIKVTLQEACDKYDLVIQNRELTSQLMIVNAELEERIHQRTAELARANTFIGALNRVAVRMQTDLDYRQLIQTLEEELKQLNLHAWIQLVDTTYLAGGSPNKSVDSRTSDSNLPAPAQNPIAVLKYFGQFAGSLTDLQPVFIPKMSAWGNELATSLQSENQEFLNSLLEISPSVSGVLLPLKARQGLLGILILWGQDLVEGDLAALVIFASQVAIAVENARFFEIAQHLAETDGLTGVYNRGRLLELSEHEFQRAKRYHHPLSVLMLDIDNFKQVNDNHGHQTGDQVLQEIAKRCQHLLREHIDLFGRYGGDEFVAVLPETDLPLANSVAERLLAQVSQSPIMVDNEPITVSITLGASCLIDDHQTLDLLLNQADQAMYAAKRAGRGRVGVAGKDPA